MMFTALDLNPIPSDLVTPLQAAVGGREKSDKAEGRQGGSGPWVWAVWELVSALHLDFVIAIVHKYACFCFGLFCVQYFADGKPVPQYRSSDATHDRFR